MRKLLIGSQAMKIHFPGTFNRTPKDTDYAVDKDVKSGNRNVEYLYNPVILKYEQGDVISKEGLLSLKISHLFWEYNFDKHLHDVLLMLEAGIKPDYGLIEELRIFWEGYLPKVRRSELNNSKKDFFTNAINKDVDEHDILHTKIAVVPAYTKILKDGCEVETCGCKFESLPFEDKVKVVQEETVVMAYERYSRKTPMAFAYHRQLKQNIIKHFPPYVAYFAIENYKGLLQVPKEMFNKLGFINKQL